MKVQRSTDTIGVIFILEQSIARVFMYPKRPAKTVNILLQGEDTISPDVRVANPRASWSFSGSSVVPKEGYTILQLRCSFRVIRRVLLHEWTNTGTRFTRIIIWDIKMSRAVYELYWTVDLLAGIWGYKLGRLVIQ